MSTSETDTASHRERLLPAVLVGAVAGLVVSWIMMWFNPQGWIATISIYAAASCLAALVASVFAPSSLLEVWGLLFVGIAVGVFLSVLIHPTLGSGERNLWPFEVAFFWVIGLAPAWLGLFVGRLLRLGLGSLSPSNNRWRGP